MAKYHYKGVVIKQTNKGLFEVSDSTGLPVRTFFSFSTAKKWVDNGCKEEAKQPQERKSLDDFITIIHV